MPLPSLKWVDFSSVEARQRIQKAIAEVITPSWIGSIPRDFGHASAGTMKAYQWRLLWTIHIPLALVSLWSPSSPTCQGDIAVDPRLLKTVMHFAATATLLHKYKSTPARCSRLRFHLKSHIDGLKVLFPGVGVPTYHLAMHIPDFIPLFGPPRNWWCYPFERIIGKLQRMKHNHRYGVFPFSSIPFFFVTQSRAIGKNSTQNVVQGVYIPAVALTLGRTGFRADGCKVIPAFLRKQACR